MTDKPVLWAQRKRSLPSASIVTICNGAQAFRSVNPLLR